MTMHKGLMKSVFLCDKLEELHATTINNNNNNNNNNILIIRTKVKVD